MTSASIQYTKTLFIFRRDLRIKDNTALIKAIKESGTIVPCFIFDPRQVGDANEYRSTNALQFMVESLQDLETQLKKHGARLSLFYGNAEDVIEKIIKKEKIDAVFCNRDYTPFSIKRDEAIHTLCTHHHVAFIQCDDALLNPPEAVMTQTNTPYSVFTAFQRTARKISVTTPVDVPRGTWSTKTIATENEKLYKKVLPRTNKQIFCHGGSTNAHKILTHLDRLAHYESTHDIPSLATSNLSAHLKFGTVSPRQVHAAIVAELGKDHPLIKQLYWRDFFTYVAYHSPFVFGHAYHRKYDKLPWKNNAKEFKAWCEGTTGFPLVDAGMRQLNTTGFMHNRVRMIVASFLTKDLHIDWQWGERYFAQKLIDYDPCVNNGNWQWAASTGCDAQPYFRIFNPWLQQKKFDPECVYIKQWIPELRTLSSRRIHAWFKEKQSTANYPLPIVDHAKESAAAKIIYRNAHD